MATDSIIDELHRIREEMFLEFNNDPSALLLYLQEKERLSPADILPPPDESLPRTADAAHPRRTRRGQD